MWLKEGTPNPGRFGEFPGHARAMQADMADMVLVAKKHYPNLRIVYLSSRTFGGYAYDARNPEPYAYENAFSVRWLIQSQMNGEAGGERGDRSNYDAQRRCPVCTIASARCCSGDRTSGPTERIRVRATAWFGKRPIPSERDGMHPSTDGTQESRGYADEVLQDRSFGKRMVRETLNGLRPLIQPLQD